MKRQLLIIVSLLLVLVSLANAQVQVYFDNFDKMQGLPIDHDGAGDFNSNYNSVNVGNYSAYTEYLAGLNGCDNQVNNNTGYLVHNQFQLNTGDGCLYHWFRMNVSEFYNNTEMLFEFNYSYTGVGSTLRYLELTYVDVNGTYKSSTAGLVRTGGTNLIEVVNLSQLVPLINLQSPQLIGLVGQEAVGLSTPVGQLSLYHFKIYNDVNEIPSIISINYSDTSIDLLYNDTIYVDAYAQDQQSDNVYWAYSCDFSGVSTPNRTSEEYMSNGTNISELSERFNLASGITFSNVYEVDTLIGYALNVSMIGGLQDFYRNATDDAGITSSYITTHVITGFDNLGGSDSDGLFFGARDSTGLFLWGLFSDNNQSQPSGSREKLYRMDASGNFNLLTSSNDIPDRVYVNVDLNAQTYFVMVDTDFDGTIDYTSSTYPLLNTVSEYHDTYFFTSGMALPDGWDYFNLTITTPTGDQWIDTLFVEYTELPQFNLTAMNSNSFQCTYSSVGTYDIRTWVTDDNHPNNYSSYQTQSIIVSQGSIPASIDCTGFVNPTCTGTCWFFDDFDYNYSIACNTWNGGNLKMPVNGELQVEDTFMDSLSLWIQYNDIPQDPIFGEEYNTFTISFDFEARNDYRTTFVVYDKNIDKVPVYLFWENGQMYALQSGSPTLKPLWTFTNSVQYPIDIVVDFRNEEVTYTFQDNFSDSKTVNFFDSGSESAGSFYFTPIDFTNSYLIVDNFLITYGNENPDFDGVLPTDTTYTFNPDLFCAINWTTNVTTDRFKEEYCTMRGYNTNYPLLSLCIPRACFSDVSSWMFQSATDNIFTTIVIVTIFILVAPLLISLRRR